MPSSFEMLDDNGMSALHYACTRSTDVEVFRTILSYMKDNINLATRDGYTAADLVMERRIEMAKKMEIIKLLRNNGAKTSLEINEAGAGAGA